jgi:Uma2 family endonuclease
MTSVQAIPTASELSFAALHSSNEHLLFVEGTLADFYAIEERRADYIEGIIVRHSPASLSHERTFLSVISHIYHFVKSRKLCTVLGSRSLVAFSDEHRFEPDILFIAQANTGVWVQHEREFRGIPELILEILSPSTRHYDLNVKRTLYQHYGVAETVCIDQRERRIIIDTLITPTAPTMPLPAPQDSSAEPLYNSLILQSGSAASAVLTGFEWSCDDVFNDTL